jgi:Rod binding domain-containing protein
MNVNPATAQSPHIRGLAEPRLTAAAHEFEAQLMKELLKPMVHATEADSDSDSGFAGALSDFAGEALGQALSMRGGLGIADSIIRNLSRNEIETKSAINMGKGSSWSDTDPR